jgi:hypothetical protein
MRRIHANGITFHYATVHNVGQVAGTVYDDVQAFCLQGHLIAKQIRVKYQTTNVQTTCEFAMDDYIHSRRVVMTSHDRSARRSDPSSKRLPYEHRHSTGASGD